MAQLSSCYFCGTAIDAPLKEYPVVPRELDPSREREETVVLCPACHRKLSTVLEHVLEAADDRRRTMPGDDRDGPSLTYEFDDPSSSPGKFTATFGDADDADDEYEPVFDATATEDENGEPSDDSVDGDEADDDSVDGDRTDRHDPVFAGPEVEPDSRDEVDGGAGTDVGVDDDVHEGAEEGRGGGEEQDGGEGRDAGGDRPGGPADRSTDETEPLATGREPSAEGQRANRRAGGDRGAGGTGTGAGTGAGTGTGTGGSAGPTARTYNRVVRLLQNREFPVERAEIEEVATNAYGISSGDFDAVVDTAIDRGVLEDRDGRLHRP